MADVAAPELPKNADDLSPSRVTAADTAEASTKVLTTNESPKSSSERDDSPAPAVQDPKSAFAARMARFKALQADKAAGNKETLQAVIAEKRSLVTPSDALKKTQTRHDQAAWKLAKAEDADGRKRAWDYMADESEKWDKHVAKKQRNKESNVFSDYQKEANKTYKRQVKQMDKDYLQRYRTQKADKIRNQILRGVLELHEDDSGNPFSYNPVNGQINEPAPEQYQTNHKPDPEALDRLVKNEEKREAARLAARAKRLGNQDESGDVTYINEKNKQFNNKLSRFYNKFTTEIRDNFERGTAI